jgi:hypothetical protein
MTRSADRRLRECKSANRSRMWEEQEHDVKQTQEEERKQEQEQAKMSVGT